MVKISGYFIVFYIQNLLRLIWFRETNDCDILSFAVELFLTWRKCRTELNFRECGYCTDVWLCSLNRPLMAVTRQLGGKSTVVYIAWLLCTKQPTLFFYTIFFYLYLCPQPNKLQKPMQETEDESSILILRIEKFCINVRVSQWFSSFLLVSWYLLFHHPPHQLPQNMEGTTRKKTNSFKGLSFHYRWVQCKGYNLDAYIKTRCLI